jgi:DNA repair and recombination protein RAD52
MFTNLQVDMLKAPLSREHVKEREQSGRKFSYVEGWHAIAEANRIFGFAAWSRETLETRQVAEAPRKIGKDKRDGWSVSYIARVRVIVDGVTREGTGAGHGIDTDLGIAHESAIKEAETDAMKRALMTFGNPFGLALYDKYQREVEDVPPPAPKPKQIAAPTAAREPVADRLIKIIATKDSAIDLGKWWNDDRVMAAFANLAQPDQARVDDARKAHLANLDNPFQEAAQ